MIPIFSTSLAIIICLTGLDQHVPSEMVLNGWSALPFLILPLGEGLVFLAKRKRFFFQRKGRRLVALFFSQYPLIAFAAGVFFLGWTALPETFDIGLKVLYDKALLFIGYLLLANFSRFFRSRFFAALDHLPASQGRQSLEMALRGELTLVVPFTLFILFSDLIALNETVATWIRCLPLIQWSGLLVLFIGFAYTTPRLIRWIWGLQPLPVESAVRQSLIGFMEKRGFRAREILLWPTGGLLLNAAVVGLTGKSRIILFTDTMLKHCSHLELRAVLAHELGHGKYRHLPAYFIFSITFILGLSLLESFLTPLDFLANTPELLYLILGGLMLVYWWLIFGLLSRRFEMEADLFGASAVGNPALFMHTLDKIARVGRFARKKSGWRHFSIERRVESLRKVFYEDPVAALRFWIKMRWMRRSLYSLCLVTLLFFGYLVSVDTVAGLGVLAMEKGDLTVARSYLESAARLPLGANHRWTLLQALIESSEIDEADSLLQALCLDQEPGTLPDNARVYHVLIGIDQLTARQFDRCRNTLERATHLFPDDGKLVALKKLVHLYMGGLVQPFENWFEKTKQNARENPNSIWRHFLRQNEEQ